MSVNSGQFPLPFPGEAGLTLKTLIFASFLRTGRRGESPISCALSKNVSLMLCFFFTFGSGVGLLIARACILRI
jgi:hypothetical protein